MTQSLQLMLDGIERVIGNQSTDWTTNYEGLVGEFLNEYQFFTGETVTQWMIERIGQPTHPNAWGAMFNVHFSKSNHVVWTGRLVPSSAPLSHATPIREYKSKAHKRLETQQ